MKIVIVGKGGSGKTTLAATARPLREGENGVGDRCRHKTTSSFDFKLLGGINWGDGMGR